MYGRPLVRSNRSPRRFQFSRSREEPPVPVTPMGAHQRDGNDSPVERLQQRRHGTAVDVGVVPGTVRDAVGHHDGVDAAESGGDAPARHAAQKGRQCPEVADPWVELIGSKRYEAEGREFFRLGSAVDVGPTPTPCVLPRSKVVGPDTWDLGDCSFDRAAGFVEL